jgi:RNA polymerase sigma factor (sigma-70 family)
MINQPVTPQELTDAESIRDSLGTPASFSVVFERHFGSVHRYVHRRLGLDLADDLGAETFLVAFDNRSRYDFERPDARAWLLGIANNLVRNHRRAERRWLKASARVADEQLRSPQTFKPPPYPFVQEEIARSLRRLARRDREPFVLFVWADLSYEEIATALDIPIGTVRSRINRARRHMQNDLGLPEANASTPRLLLGTLAGDRGDRNE